MIGQACIHVNVLKPVVILLTSGQQTSDGLEALREEESVFWDSNAPFCGSEGEL